MAHEWYLEKRPPTYYSGYESEDFNNDAVDGFEDVLNSFVGVDVIIYKGNPFMDSGIDTKVIIQNVTSDSETNSYKRQVLSRIGEIECGDYVYHKKAKRFYLAVGLSDNNGMYEKCIFYYCNWNLKFISPTTSKVVTYPICDLNSTQYNSGVTEKAQVRIGTSQHMLYIPYNNETILVDHDRRFLIDKNNIKPTAYKLTQVDSVSANYGNKGVLKWTVSEDTLNLQTDNLELMVADYETFVTTRPDDFSDNNSVCKIVGADYIKCGGNKRSYKVDFFDNNKSSVIWCIDDLMNKGIDYDIFENEITIYCDNTSLIGTSFTLSATDSSGNFDTISKEIKVVDLYERS